MDEKITKTEIVGSLVSAGLLVTALVGQGLQLYQDGNNIPRTDFIGPISNNIGDVNLGMLAALGGYFSYRILEKVGLDEKYAMAAGIGVLGILTTGIVLNETIGLGVGTPDIADIPAAIGGILCMGYLIAVGERNRQSLRRIEENSNIDVDLK